MAKSDYDSVGEFHKKFGLPTEADGPPRELTAEELRFRFGFLVEELAEYAEAMGVELYAIWRVGNDGGHSLNVPTALPGHIQDLPKAADALIDLSYVTLGAGQMMRLPWAALFADVQRANNTKERCGIGHIFKPIEGVTQDQDACGHGNDAAGYCGRRRVEHSLRGSALDVIKPVGWSGPSTHEILLRAGWNGPALPLEGE